MFVINKNKMEHIYDYSPKNFNKKYASSVRHIQVNERELIDLPYIDDHSFYF